MGGWFVGGIGGLGFSIVFVMGGHCADAMINKVDAKKISYSAIQIRLKTILKITLNLTNLSKLL